MSWIPSRAVLERVVRSLGITAAALVLMGAGCTESTSSDQPPECVMRVVSGGTGGSDSGGDGPGGGDGGDGGAGALGRFRGAIVSVFREDGELLGEAPVGNDGLVTVYVCDYQGPVEVEVRGQPGAQYWDESIDAWVEFGEGQSLHAVLPAVTGDFGITPLTEAVYQYLGARDLRLRLAEVATEERTGKSSLRTKAVPTADDIAAASRLVRDVINAHLDAVWALDDVGGFLVPIGPETAAGSVPDDPEGRYALLVAAFARQAKTFNPDLASPALAWSQQFARDLRDGVLNGVDELGQAVAPAGERAYDPPAFSQALSQALNEMSRKYGVAQTQPSPDGVVAAWGARADTPRVVVLMADGRVEEGMLNLDGDEPTDLRQIGSNVATAFAAPFSTGGLFLRQVDGTVMAFGDNSSGELGTGDRSLRTDPVEIPALRGATEIALGDSHTIARLADGSVVGMGSDFFCELGDCSEQYVLLPALIDLEGGAAISVAAASDASFAVMSDGWILSWGSETRAGDGPLIRGLLGSGQVVFEGRAPGAVVTEAGLPLENVISVASSTDTVFAIDSEGQVWSWGENFGGSLGVSSEQVDFRPYAAPVPGVAPLRKYCGRAIAAGFVGFIQVALDRSGRLWAWGGNMDQAAVLAGYPNLRDCISSDLGIHVTALDGSRLRVGVGGVPEEPFY